MATAPASKKDRGGGASLAPVDPIVVEIDDVLTDPTAGMVLHRVLAQAARTFLVNDMDEELVDTPDPFAPAHPLTAPLADRPLWARSAASASPGSPRRASEVERVHQSRVALRRIRSNLRTFRLALDPAWGTSLRAELAWYGGRLGQVRDLHILRDVVTVKGPEALDPEDVDRLDSVVGVRMAAALADVAKERRGTRRFQLNEQMMVLWDGPEFKHKARRPAEEVLPPMLHRAWRDLRGAARTARKDRSDVNLHKLRIRLKDLRYGCETVALVEGGPARKTARAAEQLQSKLGDLHDADFSITWFEELARDHHDLRQPVAALVELQQGAASTARKGWNRDLKVIERRWRAWQG
ncbi:MAG TPA: CHAD domain-containing protein [Acidimicrobiales bacterium]